MDPKSSRLLIVDHVLPDQRAHLGDAEMDLVMWMDQSGRERTRGEWATLFESVGLELVQVWRSPESLDCVLEGRRK